MKTFARLGLGAIALATLALAHTQPAEARIRCNGPWQVTKHYGEIGSLYCGDKYLAHVARYSYGISVSFAMIRHNYNVKEEVCQQIGHDNRVSSICTGLRIHDRGGRKWP